MIPQTRLVHVDPERAATMLAAVCERFDFPVKDEYSTPEVADLMRRCGYAVTPAVVAEFVRKGYITDTDNLWTPVDVFHFSAALDSRRRWLPTPCVHDARKSGFRLQVETLRNQGVDPPVNDLDQHSLEDLLIQLTTADDRPTREMLYELIRLKLEGFEE
jgi:hypothetical protein